jgi:multidrug transporter EmrE-like cation transporter
MWMAGLILFEAVANYFAKKYAVADRMLFFWIASSFFFVCNTCWMLALKSGMTLQRGAVIFAVSSTTLAIMIGFLFGETLTPRQTVGIGVGLIAIYLLY